MTTPIKINLQSAMAAFAVANTPMYLFRKLRADHTIQETSKHASAKEIYASLKSSLSQPPKSLEDSVRPYAYLVALLFAGEAPFIMKARTISAPHHPWYSYLSNAVALEIRPTTTTEVHFQTKPGRPKISHSSSSTSSVRRTGLT